LTQPLISVPITAYVAVVNGEKETVFVTLLSHVYVRPPVAVKIVVDPEQIDTSGPALIIGSGFTVTITWSVFTHPKADVPETVYVLV
jgi:hypothetical protein